MGLDQSETPYLDALLRYREADYTPFHTPGHKRGKGASEALRRALGAEVLAVDVAMAGGVEDTRESTGLIRAAEELAAAAWGAERCFFLVNGSTSGIHALTVCLARPGEHVIVPRNSHKSLQAGLIFSGAMPEYVEPTVDDQWGIPLNVPAAAVERALARRPDARALFITSPSYNGLGADLEAAARGAHAAGMPFIADQAWGPHLRFCSRLSGDAMSAGADAMVTSIHKLISGLTQSSILCARGEHLNLAHLASVVTMTQSTSPQVLIYASIDAARSQMATQGEGLWSRAVELAEWARSEIRAIAGLRCLGAEVLADEGVASFDPTRLTVSARELGHTGYRLETILRDDYRIAVEAADPVSVVLNVTYGDSQDDMQRLVAALRDYAARYQDERSERLMATSPAAAPPPPFTRQVMSPRDAFFAASTALPLAQCAGHVSAELVTPYPPGIPVLGPGEHISPEIVEYLAAGTARAMRVHGPEDPSLATLRVVS